MAEWLSTGRHARAICDNQQRILWHNSNFDELLQRTGSLKVERDILSLVHKKEQAALSDFLHDERAHTTVIWLSDWAGQARWVLQGQRIQAPAVPTAFGLRIADNTDFLASDFHNFESFFGLTRQEATICRLELQGKTVQDIVECEGKSHDTVRFHIRNI